MPSYGILPQPCRRILKPCGVSRSVSKSHPTWRTTSKPQVKPLAVVGIEPVRETNAGPAGRETSRITPGQSGGCVQPNVRPSPGRRDVGFERAVRPDRSSPERDLQRPPLPTRRGVGRGCGFAASRRCCRLGCRWLLVAWLMSGRSSGPAQIPREGNCHDCCSGNP